MIENPPKLLTALLTIAWPGTLPNSPSNTLLIEAKGGVFEKATRKQGLCRMVVRSLLVPGSEAHSLVCVQSIGRNKAAMGRQGSSLGGTESPSFRARFLSTFRASFLQPTTTTPTELR